MRPIPRALLIHSAALLQPSVDENGGETLTEAARLTRVRVDPLGTETLLRDEARLANNALLFYDARNSRPRNVLFSVGQKIEHDGTRYRVDTVELLYDGRRLHHVELGLSG